MGLRDGGGGGGEGKRPESEGGGTVGFSFLSPLTPLDPDVLPSRPHQDNAALSYGGPSSSGPHEQPPPLPPPHQQVAAASGRRTRMSSPSWRKLLASLQPDMDTEQRLRLLRLVARMK